MTIKPNKACIANALVLQDGIQSTSRKEYTAGDSPKLAVCSEGQITVLALVKFHNRAHDYQAKQGLYR